MGYTLTDETRLFDNRTLRRVLYDDGTRGGWIEHQGNLDVISRVEDQSVVYGQARVSDEAIVFGLGVVRGSSDLSGHGSMVGNNAVLEGSARATSGTNILDDSIVSGDAYLTNNTQVYRDSRISGHAHVMNSMISCDAQITGTALVENAVVTANAIVSGTAVVDVDVEIGNNAELFRKDHLIYLKGLTYDPFFVYRLKGGDYHATVGCQNVRLDEYDMEELAKQHDYPLPDGWRHIVAMLQSKTDRWQRDVHMK